MKEGIRKGDLVLLIAVVAIGGILWAFVRGTATEGGTAVVMIDGEEYGRYPLDAEVSEEIVSDRGRNVLEIAGGECRLTDADCKDLLCVKQGKISLNGQSIICLPHRLVITIEGGKESGVDVIAQ